MIRTDLGYYINADRVESVTTIGLDIVIRDGQGIAKYITTPSVEQAQEQLDRLIDFLCVAEDGNVFESTAKWPI